LSRGCFFLWGLIFSLGLGACCSANATVEVPVETPSQKIIISTPSQHTSSPTVSLRATNQLQPSQTVTPLECWSEGGQIELTQLSTELLKEPLLYRVYTPPCYNQQTNQHYPVLYLIHGQTYTDDQWDRLGADETADRLITSGEIVPLIIVMPFDAHDRMLPPENAFGEAFVQALIPEIDKNYRTLPDREHRAIGGLSRGGNWAIHIGYSNWELFGSMGLHSTPTFAIDGINHLRDELISIPVASLPRIYMDIGEHDRWGYTTQQLETMLTEENIPHEWHLFPGYHDEAYWGAHIEGYLRWYAATW
jgi:enterochelin esterase-like enzyme